MRRNKGFTLIEVIVTLTLVAIAASIMVGYMGTAFTRSAVPAGMVNTQYGLIQEMEAITAQYRQQLESGTIKTENDLATFKTNFVDTSPSVNATNTALAALTSGGYTTQKKVLLVTLRQGDQSVKSIFTY